MSQLNQPRIDPVETSYGPESHPNDLHDPDAFISRMTQPVSQPPHGAQPGARPEPEEPGLSSLRRANKPYRQGPRHGRSLSSGQTGFAAVAPYEDNRWTQLASGGTDHFGRGRVPGYTRASFGSGGRSPYPHCRIAYAVPNNVYSQGQTQGFTQAPSGKSLVPGDNMGLSPYGYSTPGSQGVHGQMGHVRARSDGACPVFGTSSGSSCARNPQVRPPPGFQRLSPSNPPYNVPTYERYGGSLQSSPYDRPPDANVGEESTVRSEHNLLNLLLAWLYEAS